MRSTAFLVIAFFCLPLLAHAQWIKQNANTTASLRGLSVVNEKIVWASGTGGTVIRTIDGGKTWDVITVPGTEKLDFRDIEAFDANTAYILSIGNGESSRIYKTIDGGKNWSLQYKNDDPKKFFDAIACWDRDNCIAMSDPVDGHFPIISTSDGGKNWKPLVSNQMAEAHDGEAAFAASGTCLISAPAATFFAATGGSTARVIRGNPPKDRGGYGWRPTETPINSGKSSQGIFSIAMYDDLKHGVIVGGNYEQPEAHDKNLAFTTDGGATWKLGTGLNGYRSAVTYVDKKTIIAVGTNGSDISQDGGATWLRIDGANYNAVQSKGKNSIWADGPKGYVARLDWQDFLSINGYKPCPKNAICDGPWVFDLHLSHSEISSVCLQTNSECSDKREIEVTTTANDVPPNWYEYAVSGGQIVGFGPNVRWDLSDAKPGTYTITVGLKIPFGDAFMVLGQTKTKVVVIK